MSEARTIARNAVVLAAARSIDRGVSTFLAFVVARKLGTSGLGIYTAATVYHSAIIYAAALGATSYVVREIAKHPAKTNSLVVHLCTFTGTAAALGIAICLAVVPHFGYSEQMTHAIYLVLAAVIPTAFCSILEGVFIAHQRVHFITLTSLVSAVANAGVTLWMLHHGFGVVSLVAAFVIVQYLIASCYFAFLTRFIAPLRWEFDRATARMLLRDIRPFAGSSILNAFLARPEVFFLSILHSETRLGQYSAALKLVDLWSLIPQIYMTNVFPLMSRSAGGEGKNFIALRDQSLRFLLAISLPLSAGIIGAAPQIIRFVYGSGFEGSVQALRILALTIPLVSIFAVTWRVLSAKGQQGRVMNFQIISALVRVTAGFALVYAWSAIGGALSVLLSTLVLVSLLHYSVQKNDSPIPLASSTWRFAASAAVTGLVAALAGTRVPFLVAVTIGMGVYLVMLLSLRAVSAREIEMFSQFVFRSEKKRTASGAVP